MPRLWAGAQGAEEGKNSREGENLKEEQEHLSNRQKKMENKVGSDWCHGCDAARNPEGAKCPVCGRFEGNKRYKKHVKEHV